MQQFIIKYKWPNIPKISCKWMNLGRLRYLGETTWGTNAVPYEILNC